MIGKLAGHASAAVGPASNAFDAFAAGDNTIPGYPSQGAEVDEELIVGVPHTSVRASGSASDKTVETDVASVEDDFVCEDGGGLLWDVDSFDPGSRR